MIDKRLTTVQDAIKDVKDGATILISGFGGAGSPIELIHALLDQGARNLTIVSNNAGNGQFGLASLLQARRVAKMVCSFPKSSDSTIFDEVYRSGETELELVPQGTLAERIRAGGAGIPAFYTPTAAGTPLEKGKEVRTFNGRSHVLEHAISGDVALVKAWKGDRWGNLVYNKTARQFGPVMCMAAKTSIVQVREIVELGILDPESIVTPSIFVKRIIEVPKPAEEHELLTQGMKRLPQ
jgi:3-oxoadipate CoA-transferase, alpha subunit